MPAPGEEHSLCGSVSVLSCAPPRPASLSVCMYDCQYETPCGLVVCVPLPGTDESEQRGNSVVARRAGRPRSARLAPATRHLPQILRSSRSRLRLNYPGGSVHVRNTGTLRPRRPARRPALGPAYPSGVCTPPHAASPATPPMPRPAGHTRARSPRVRRGAQWGGKPTPRRRRKPPSAVTRVSATRPSRYVRVPASARAPWGLSVGWGRWPLPLAPGTRRAKRRTWHPSIHNFALSGKSSQSQVSTCSGRARAAWPFMAILCHTFSFVIPFFGEMRTRTRKVLESYTSCAERSTRRARISPVQLRLQCVASPCRSA